MISFLSRNWIKITFLLLLIVILGYWLKMSLTKSEMEVAFRITLFQSVQLFSTILIGCWISHVISAAYSKREKRINVCCESIDKMCEMIQVSKTLLLSYVINSTQQKNAEMSQAVLGFFSNLSAELSLLKGTLDTDKALTSTKLVTKVGELAEYLRSTKDIITENALCNGTKKRQTPNNEMLLAANQFFDQCPTRLRNIKIGLLQ